MQYMFQFYLQIFTGAQCGFLVSCGRCPICKRFRPKSYESGPHTVAAASANRARISSKLARRSGTKTLSLT